MIAIVDYGAGNLMSVKKALDYIGAENEITNDAFEIEKADHIILPGVGSFGASIESMYKYGLYDAVRKAALSEKPFLGICLGLQLLFKNSEESPNSNGLNILNGKISSLPSNLGIKVPHMGWNSINIKKKGGIFKDIPDESYFYFVHSFFLNGADKEIVAATTEYGVEIECAVEKGNLTATQFHPEKSGELGLMMLKNFISMEA